MGGRTIGHNKKGKRSKEKQQADFLARFSTLASVSKACKLSRVPRSNIYDWLKIDTQFKQLYDLTADQALGALEDEAVRRAFEGTNRPVFQGGKKVGLIREYSDTLLIVLLKARAPEKYKDRMYQELTGKGGGPVATESKIINIASKVPLAQSEEEIK